jgi:hypothetical protein
VIAPGRHEYPQCAGAGRKGPRYQLLPTSREGRQWLSACPAKKLRLYASCEESGEATSAPLALQNLTTENPVLRNLPTFIQKCEGR